ncbi:hypothetical protein GCM10023187_45900 [Nibrella viscosa]|uniref:Uncharacterized protein n=1 Tax=Nibrella viscosa TaxID=1084524 RepID=A0ABP8KTD5_9BACT
MTTILSYLLILSTTFFSNLGNKDHDIEQVLKALNYQFKNFCRASSRITKVDLDDTNLILVYADKRVATINLAMVKLKTRYEQGKSYVVFVCEGRDDCYDVGEPKKETPVFLVRMSFLIPFDSYNHALSIKGNLVKLQESINN